MSLFFVLATGCGDDTPSNAEACADVECPRGVCVDGACSNADQCTDDEACLAGYQCSGGVCVVTNVCAADGTCERGVCQSGACVNAESCSTNDECVSDYFCDEGTCAPDPCSTTTCDRGVCEVGTGACVNASACTSANEDIVCLEGNRCLDGACVGADDFCESLDCQLGVCDFEEGECVNAESCTEDTECVEGSYCADDGTCQLNLCDAQGTNCGLGTCDRDTGECVNAETCDSADDCLNGFLCVDAACVATDAACGEGGCPGNQVCEYDEGARSAACVENAQAPCASALDCADDRVCVAGACAAPTACEPDAYEPNDLDADATDFQAETASNQLAANLCGADVDLFTFDTLADEDAGGTLLVDLAIASEDLGAGVLTVELFDPSGASVATSTTEAGGAPTTSARIEYAVDATNEGVYTIAIDADAAINAGGVDYALTVDLVDADVVSSCASAQPLPASGVASGDTTESLSYALESSCSQGGTPTEDVWTLTVTEPSYASIRLLPASTADLSVSIRSTCTQPLSELAGGCVDAEGTGGIETLEMPLEPGTYTLIVQPTAAGGGGVYDLSVSLEPLVCTPGTGSCVDSSSSSVCNELGTGYESVACENGCDATVGLCTPDAGDQCRSAIEITSFPHTESIDWNLYKNDYDPGPNGCVPDNSNSETDGADVVYEIVVPDGHAMVAELDRDSGDYVSLYALTDCSDLGNACVAASNRGRYSDEEMVYANESGADQTIYVVADISANSDQDLVEFSVDVTPIVCTPGQNTCAGPNQQRESWTCNDLGTGYTDTVACPIGCDGTTGQCVTLPNDLCSGAIAISDGSVETGNAAAMNSDYEQGECGSMSTYDDDGRDTVYVLQNLNVGDTVTLTLETQGIDGAIWISRDCVSDTIPTCVDGVDDSETEDVTESLTFVADGAGDYFVVVEAEDGDTTGTYTLTTSVQQPACTPGTVFACNADNTAVEYCNDFGLVTDLSCGDAGCDAATGRCAAPQGRNCFDAIPVSGPSGTLTGTHNVNDNWLQTTDESAHGDCYFPGGTENDGPETVYSVFLAAGERLTVDFDGMSSGMVYLMEACGDFDTCYGMRDDGDSTFTYQAPASGEVFLVVDGTYSSSSSYELDYTIGFEDTEICVPSSWRCIDSMTLEVCSADGSMSSLVTCADGCAGGACQVAPAPVNETCEGALDIGTGVQIAFDPDDITNDMGAACVGDGDGKDLFYKVTLQPYEMVRVTGQSSYSWDDAVVSIFERCESVPNSCLAGADDGNAEAVYQAGATAETVYISLDSDDDGDDDWFYYGIEIVTPECMPTEAPFCNVDGDLEYCDNGSWVTYTCDNGCLGGACDAPTGESCQEAIKLTNASGTVSGNYGTFGDDVQLAGDDEHIGACDVPDYDDPDGADIVYQIDLAAGETLTASLDTAETTAVLWITDDCTSEYSCLSLDSLSDVRTVSYKAQAAETVFLVVDNTSSTSSDAYTLTYSVDATAICAPGAQACSDANTLAVCNADGTAYEAQYSCSAGCYKGGCLMTTLADTCTGALDVGRGGIFYDTYADLTNDVEFNGCIGETGDGPDFFFQVTLAANEIVRVNAVVADYTDPLVYIFTDCTSAETSCLAGAHEDAPGQDNQDVTVEYQATTAGTYFIGVDTEDTPTSWSNVDDPFRVQIDVLTPNCDPSTYGRLCNADGTAIEYCDETGFIREYACQGVGTCTNARCDEPVGEVCFDAFDGNPPAGSTSVTLNGVLGDFTDDYDLPIGNACTGSITPAADSAYVVDLLAGQTLTASLLTTAATPEDLAFYVTPTCEEIADWCVAGADAVPADGSTPETLTYTATMDETVYLIVDSFFASSAGEYQLTVDVQ